ncbi:hypothetical protein [Blastococcus deserti]
MFVTTALARPANSSIARCAAGVGTCPRTASARYTVRPSPDRFASSMAALTWRSRSTGESSSTGYGRVFSSWLNPTAVLGGVLAVLVCAYLAAVCSSALTRGPRRR